MMTKEEDGLTDIVIASSLDTVLFFTDRGKVYSERAYRYPGSGARGQRHDDSQHSRAGCG